MGERHRQSLRAMPPTGALLLGVAMPSRYRIATAGSLIALPSAPRATVLDGRHPTMSAPLGGIAAQ
jgi:hypothetical protein